MCVFEAQLGVNVCLGLYEVAYRERNCQSFTGLCVCVRVCVCVCTHKHVHMSVSDCVPV